MLACFDMKEIFQPIFEALPGKCLCAVIGKAYFHIIVLHRACTIFAVTADMRLATKSATALRCTVLICAALICTLILFS